MSKCHCTDCGTAFATGPAFDCPRCGGGNMAVESNETPQNLSGGDEPVPVEKLVFDMLFSLAERIHQSCYDTETWNKIIDRTIQNLRPYLKDVA